MGAEKDIIVAVELGSTAIRAIAGKKEPDGTMQVLAIAQVPASNSIRKGVIDNLDKTTQAITTVVNKLNSQLDINIVRIYIGLSGQSLHTEKNQVPYQFAEKTQISNELIDQLRDINRGVVYTDSKILEAIPQEYRVGNRPTQEPVGMMAEQVEARFMNVIARSSLVENIEKCVQNAGLGLVDILISPMCLADSLLSANEKRSGCALVDMGAEITTVSVYTNNILRHLAVIPLGGNNATIDITSKGIEIEEAEQLKLKYGTAIHENDETSSPQKIQLNYNQTINEDELQDIIESRYEEILVNVWAQIKSHSEKLLSGFVITGGASRIKNISQAFTEYSHTERSIRVTKGLPNGISLAPSVHIADNDNLYTLMALLLKGNQECVGEKPVAQEATPVQEEIDFNAVEEEEEHIEEEKQTIETLIEESEESKPKKEKSTFKDLFNKLKKMLEEPEDSDN